jgi:hypothetical protein
MSNASVNSSGARERLREIVTLIQIIFGNDDPVVPPADPEASPSQLPQSKFLPLDC